MAATKTSTGSNLYKRSSSPYWWLRCQIDRREIRASLKTADLAEAKRRKEIFLERHHIESLDVARTDWTRRCTAAMADGSSWLRATWVRANNRNKKLGSNRVMSLRSVYLVALKSRGRCAITGIPFEWNGDKANSGPYAISMDRIRCGEPYSRRNCRMVLRAVNMAMNVWGEDVFWQVAKRAVGRRLLSYNEQI